MAKTNKIISLEFLRRQRERSSDQFSARNFCCRLSVRLREIFTLLMMIVLALIVLAAFIWLDFDKVEVLLIVLSFTLSDIGARSLDVIDKLNKMRQTAFHKRLKTCH